MPAGGVLALPAGSTFRKGTSSLPAAALPDEPFAHSAGSVESTCYVSRSGPG